MGTLPQWELANYMVGDRICWNQIQTGKNNPSIALPLSDDVNWNCLVRTELESRWQVTKNNFSFSDVVEVDVKGIHKLAVVVGVSNTHVHVHHVVEDGVWNPNVDVDGAAAVAAGDIPPTITTYEITTTKPNPIEEIFTKDPMNCNMYSK